MQSENSDDSSSSEAISDSSESSVELMDVEEFKDDRPMPSIFVPSARNSQQTNEDQLRAY